MSISLQLFKQIKKGVKSSLVNVLHKCPNTLLVFIMKVTKRSFSRKYMQKAKGAWEKKMRNSYSRKRLLACEPIATCAAVFLS